MQVPNSLAVAAVVIGVGMGSYGIASAASGTVIRVETDADGNAKYEAHMTDANGAPVTVYVDYNYVSTESGRP